MIDVGLNQPVEVVFVKFLRGESFFPLLTILCSLEEVTVNGPHLWRGDFFSPSLRMEYLHKVFELLLIFLFLIKILKRLFNDKDHAEKHSCHVQLEFLQI